MIHHVDVVTPMKTALLGGVDSAGSRAAAVVMARQICLRVTPEGGGGSVFYRVAVRGGVAATCGPVRRKRRR
jgi:hypothetical protein